MTPPDPSTINWDQVTLWAAGIGTGVGSMAAAAWLAIKRVAKLASTMPVTTITREDTKVITTDSVALHQLAGAMEAVNLSVIAIKILLEGEIALRKEERQAREEQDRKAEIREIARREVEDANRHADEEEKDDRRQRPGRRPNT